MELEGVLLGLFGPHAQQKPPDSSIWTRIFSSKGISWETFEQESILRLALCEYIIHWYFALSWPVAPGTNACALRNVAHLLTATSKLIEEVTKRKDAVQFDEATQALLLCSCFLALIIEGDKDRVGTFKFLLSVLDFSADVEQCKAGEGKSLQSLAENWTSCYAEVLSSLLKLQVQVGKLSIYLRTRCKSLRSGFALRHLSACWTLWILCMWSFACLMWSLIWEVFVWLRPLSLNICVLWCRRDKYIILRQTHLWLALIGCVRGNASPFLQAVCILLKQLHMFFWRLYLL